MYYGIIIPGAQSFGSAHFGEGCGSILLDNVDCLGSEFRVQDCDRAAAGNQDCGHQEDAGVQCALTGKEVEYMHGSLL